MPTVELLFGTKAQLLHVVIDVAVAGDDEPVPVLSRAWAADARSARRPRGFPLRCGAGVVAAQARSAGVVLAAYEAASFRPRHPAPHYGSRIPAGTHRDLDRQWRCRARWASSRARPRARHRHVVDVDGSGGFQPLDPAS